MKTLTALTMEVGLVGAGGSEVACVSLRVKLMRMAGVALFYVAAVACDPLSHMCTLLCQAHSLLRELFFLGFFCNFMAAIFFSLSSVYFLLILSVFCSTVPSNDKWLYLALFIKG